MLPISVVVPARNAGAMLRDCLSTIAASSPQEVIVVDGCSSDDTVAVAREFTDQILSDRGEGLPAARRLGADAASCLWVATIDADVLLPDGALSALFDEFIDDGYMALQAGLHSVGGPGYWGRALAHHHRTGRSRHWFGLVATIFHRQALLRYGFDPRFVSGEDIDLRWRLKKAGERVGVSQRTDVVHRFGDGFRFARDQWDADGRGLARMARNHGWRGRSLVGLPLAGALRGMVCSIVRAEPQWLPYYACYAAYNYRAMVVDQRAAARTRYELAPNLLPLPPAGPAAG